MYSRHSVLAALFAALTLLAALPARAEIFFDPGWTDPVPIEINIIGPGSGTL